jgi:hypothetical protein
VRRGRNEELPAVYFDSGAFPARLRAMSKLFLPVFVLVMLVVLPGCSLFHKKKPESSAHMYEGDAPTIHFSDKPENAGGAINTY